MKKNRIACCLFLLILIMQWAAFPTAFAADQESDGQLTIRCEYENTEVPSIWFSLYYVANISGSSITLSDAFASFPLDSDGLDPDGWNSQALALKGYVLANNLTPDVSGQTDQGVLLLEHLKLGLYLIIGETAAVDGYIYTSTPFLVALPYTDPETGTLSYEQTVYPKFTRQPIIEDRTVTRKVLKIWDDKDNESMRPTEITVHLYCDGKEYDAVVLNRDNNWRHTWRELPYGHDWVVAEDPVPDYTVSVKQEGITFTVKNSYIPTSPPPDTLPPDNPPSDSVPPDNPPPDNPSPGNPSPDNPPLDNLPSDNPPLDNPPSEGTPPSGDLPHTGLYWWPVLILASGGILCIVFGFICRKGRNYEKKPR